MHYTPQTSPWIPPTLGSRQNTCQQCRRILETKFVRNQTSNRFNEPYLLCYSCSPKWWWFFYDYMHPAAIPPSVNTIQTRPARPRHRTSNMSKSTCEILIRHDAGVPVTCGRIVARHCDNNLCKRHCECKGGCQLHPGTGVTLGEVSETPDPDRYNKTLFTPDQIPTYSDHPLDGISASDVLLPMPPCSLEQLEAQEQRDLNSALARSLEPISAASFQFPSNSFTSASGFTRTSTPSGSLTSGDAMPTLDTQLSDSSSPFSSNVHLRNPAPTTSTTHAQPRTGLAVAAVQTSGDRAANRALDLQSRSGRLPIASIDARLSRQMHGSWLDQFEARDASRMKAIDEEAAQKALELRCQRQFVLKFFNATGEEVIAQVIQDISDGDWPSYPLADRLPDLIGATFENIELLHVPSRSWFRIRKGHAVRLNIDIHVFLRRRGVECLDFDLHFNMFVKPPRSPNIRTNMCGERRFLAVKAKTLSNTVGSNIVPSRDVISEVREGGMLPNEESSGSEVEIMDDYVPPPPRDKRSNKHITSGSQAKPSHLGESSGSEVEIMDNYSPPPRQYKPGNKGKAIARGSQSKPRHLDGLSLSKRKIKDEPFISQLPAAKRARSKFTEPIEIDSPSDSSSVSRWAVAPPRSNSPLSEASSTPEDPEAIYPGRWPSNYHTCDILDGFRKMDSEKMMRKYPSVDDRFLEVFEQGFRNATYYDARRRLKLMKQEDIDSSKGAMRTSQGLWSRLAKKYPLKK